VLACGQLLPLTGDGPIRQLSVLDTSPCVPYSLYTLPSYDLDLCKLPPNHAGHLQHIPSCKRHAVALPLYANILIKNIGQVSAKVTMLAAAATGGGGNRYARLTSHSLVHLMEAESRMRPSRRSSTPRYLKDQTTYSFPPESLSKFLYTHRPFLKPFSSRS
jgi:hypothetical protein